MNDTELQTLIRQTLLALLAEQQYPNVIVASDYQSTSQGRTSQATIYFSKINNKRVGWQGRSHKHNLATGESTSESRQYVEITYQMQGLAPQDPTDESLPTADDLTTLAAMLVQSESFRVALQAQGVGMQRITDIRTPKFVNDRGQFEASPSFDFTVTRQDRIIQKSQSLTAAEYNFTRV